MPRLLWNSLTAKRELCHAAVTWLAPGTRTQIHSQDFYEIFLVCEGAGFHFREGRKIPLETGHLGVAGPGEKHSYSTSADQNLTFVNVAVSARWWKSLHEVIQAPLGWERGGKPHGHFLLMPAAAAELRILMFRLMEPGTEMNSALLLMWINAIAAASKPRQSPVTIPSWLEHLHRDMQDPALLSEETAFWQKRSGRSPEHLARSCRKFYGLPLTELLNRARIERVKFLLQTTDTKVTTAAYETGYNNLAHFYRVFLRLTGKTPRDWRQAAARHAVPV